MTTDTRDNHVVTPQQLEPASSSTTEPMDVDEVAAPPSDRMDVDEEDASNEEKRSENAAMGQDLTDFPRSLVVGDAVDVYCIETTSWMGGKIEEVADYRVLLHFMGWNKSADEWVDLHPNKRLAPKGSHVPEFWQQHEFKLQQRKRAREEKLLVPLEKTHVAQQPSSVDESESILTTTFVQAGATRSGRSITKRVSTGAIQRAPPTKKVAVEKLQRPEDDICNICGEIEDEELSDLLMCDGDCQTIYHLSCLGMESPPDEKEWKCEQCRTNEQICFACDRNGSIGEKGGVFKCSVKSCGKFYHQRCVDKNPCSRRGNKAPKAQLRDANDEDKEDEEDETRAFDASFRCPHHVCVVCNGEKKSSDIMSCLKCPNAYHTVCVPPSARYNNVGLICSRHPEVTLPKIPSYLGEVVQRDGTFSLPPLFLPKEPPLASDINDIHHFRLLVDFLEIQNKHPPSYRKLWRSIYTFKQPKVSLEDDPVCVCKVKCGDDCINRLSFTECYGPAPVPGMKFNKQNRESNCMLGDECGNRSLHQKVYPKFQEFYTKEKGWALRLLQPVKASELVIEYVGEVINEEEKERRLVDHATKTPNDKNMYVMELSHHTYIDARFKGSPSRFINHSCDPNCHLLKWNVRGVDRIAITALRDIEAGEELSYDYQFHTRQAMEWKCYCGAKSCRGTMAPERINEAYDSDEGKKLTKQERLKKIKRASQQERLQLEKEEKATLRRLSLTAQLSIGENNTANNAVVRVGPAPREMDWVKQSRCHVFLRRNAATGFDFLRRKQLKDKKIAKARRAVKSAEQNQKSSATLTVEGSATVSNDETTAHGTSSNEHKKSNGTDTQDINGSTEENGDERRKDGPVAKNHDMDVGMPEKSNGVV